MTDPQPSTPGDDEARDLCRRIEHRQPLTEPERAALARLVSHVVAARTVITRGDAALGNEVDRALHARGVWRNVDAALGVLLDAAAQRVRPCRPHGGQVIPSTRREGFTRGPLRYRRATEG